VGISLANLGVACATLAQDVQEEKLSCLPSCCAVWNNPALADLQAEVPAPAQQRQTVLQSLQRARELTTLRSSLQQLEIAALMKIGRVLAKPGQTAAQGLASGPAAALLRELGMRSFTTAQASSTLGMMQQWNRFLDSMVDYSDGGFAVMLPRRFIKELAKWLKDLLGCLGDTRTPTRIQQQAAVALLLGRASILTGVTDVVAEAELARMSAAALTQAGADVQAVVLGTALGSDETGSAPVEAGLRRFVLQDPSSYRAARVGNELCCNAFERQVVISSHINVTLTIVVGCLFGHNRCALGAVGNG